MTSYENPLLFRTASRTDLVERAHGEKLIANQRCEQLIAAACTLVTLALSMKRWRFAEGTTSGRLAMPYEFILCIVIQKMYFFGIFG